MRAGSAGGGGCGKPGDRDAVPSPEYARKTGRPARVRRPGATKCVSRATTDVTARRTAPAEKAASGRLLAPRLAFLRGRRVRRGADEDRAGPGRVGVGDVRLPPVARRGQTRQRVPG